MTVADSGSGAGANCHVTSSGDGLITYSRRRKRARSANSSSPTSAVSVSPVDKPTNETLSTENCNKFDLARKDQNWRLVLENILKLPDVLEGGGIQTSVADALASGPSDSQRDTAETVDRYKSHCQGQLLFPKSDISASTKLDVSETGSCKHKSSGSNTFKCQEALLDILRSKDFVLMCDLLSKSFQEINGGNMFNFGHINSKMKSGAYGQSPGLFTQDIQQVWSKYKKIGVEMVIFARNLSNISRELCQKVVGADHLHGDLANEAVEPQCEENHQHITEQKNSNDVDITTPFPSCESNHSTKPEQTEASCLRKICTCKKCGCEALGEQSLICDDCEAIYHLSCAEPPVQEIPTSSWYCSSCTKSKKQAHIKNKNGHDDCAVCDRLEFIEDPDQVKDSRESSVSTMESDEAPEPSTTALSRLCKQCGTCEDEDKRFLICGHRQCPYKYYHIRCLRTNQIASLQQRNNKCWYCPACLCRACFINKDDDKIVLCDSCDEGYHIYCMKPPRTDIPEGQWHCVQCNAAKAKEGMRRYEEMILQLHGKKNPVL